MYIVFFKSYKICCSYENILVCVVVHKNTADCCIFGCTYEFLPESKRDVSTFNCPKKEKLYCVLFFSKVDTKRLYQHRYGTVLIYNPMLCVMHIGVFPLPSSEQIGIRAVGTGWWWYSGSNPPPLPQFLTDQLTLS